MSYFTDVCEFHSITDTPVLQAPWRPEKDRIELRMTLIQEEYDEVMEVIEGGAISDLAKELADLVYVALGTAAEYGIPFDAVWNEVQKSNMAKADQVTGKVSKREDGKILKPQGWKKPDIYNAVYHPQLELSL